MAGRREFLKGVAAGGAVVIGSQWISGVEAGAEPAPTGKWTAKEFTPQSLGNWPSDVDQHLALYKGYVTKANELADLIAKADRSPEKQSSIYSELRELKLEYSFAVGGVKNHEIFFGHQAAVSKENTKPQGKLLEALEENFGSFEKWREDLKATGISARGWVWLALDLDKRTLMNYLGDSQNSYPIWSGVPILALDMFEHAFFKDYGKNRGAYIDAFLTRINWAVVENNYLRALKKAEA